MDVLDLLDEVVDVAGRRPGGGARGPLVVAATAGQNGREEDDCRLAHVRSDARKEEMLVLLIWNHG
jgi:hypothetical protein